MNLLYFQFSIWEETAVEVEKDVQSVFQSKWGKGVYWRCTPKIQGSNLHRPSLRFEFQLDPESCDEPELVLKEKH